MNVVAGGAQLVDPVGDHVGHLLVLDGRGLHRERLSLLLVGLALELLHQRVELRIAPVRGVPRAGVRQVGLWHRAAQVGRVDGLAGDAAGTPVGDAEVGLQPRLVGAGAVELRLRLDVQRDVEPGRRRHLLHVLGVLWDLQELLGRERDVDRAHPRALQQLLGLGDVLRPLWHLRGGRRPRVDGRERVVVPELCLAAQQALDEARPVERVRQRLPHLLRLPGILVDPHLQRAVLARRRLADVDVGVREQRLRALVGHLGEHVDGAALDGQHDRRRVREVLDLDGVQVGQGGPAPVLRVLDIAGALVGRERLQNERPGADPALRERPLLVVLGQDHGVVVEGRHERREVAVGAVEMELDGLVVDLLDVAVRENTCKRRQRGRTDLGIGDAIEGGDHVVDRER